MKKLSFHKSILVWFLLALSVLALVYTFTHRSFRQLDEEKKWVDHTYVVIADLKDILSDLRDIQSAQRGYIITGHVDYLVPLKTSVPKVTDNFSKLEILFRDNEQQLNRLHLVQEDARKRILLAQEIVDTYDQKGQAAAFAMVSKGTGRLEMAAIRTRIDEMIAEENRLLDARQEAVSNTSFWTLKIGELGLLSCTIILILVFWLIDRESKKRASTEESLQNALTKMELGNSQTTLLGKLSDYLQSCRSTEEAFDVIGNSLPQLLVGSSGAIAIFKNSRTSVEVMSRWGDHVQGYNTFNPDQCWALRRGRAHYYVPGGTEPCCSHFKDEPEGVSLCLPMQAQGETLGLFSIVVDSIAETSRDKVAFCRRVSEQISLALANLNLQHELREQSIRDPLTRLFNRRYLETTLDRELSRAKRNKESLSVLVLDIDYFKKFNDTMGHDAGDALLAQFAGMLEQNVRKEDIVCRYGGEEFVVVLPLANRDGATVIAQKLNEATRKLKIRTNGKDDPFSISVSIGISEYPVHAESAGDMITAADSALYRAKRNGRDRFEIAESLV